MQRRRLFIVGVNTERLQLLTPMEACSSLIQQMAHEQRKKPLRLWQCVLEDSHVAVKAERKLAEQAAENAFTEKMMGGVGWAVSHAAHAEVRNNMQKAFGQAPPKIDAWMKQVFPDNVWIHRLSPREVDVLLLHAFALEHGSGIEFKTSGFCWDPCWSIGYPQKKKEDEQHIMPCQLRNHRPWYQYIQRYLLGLEMFMAHGYRKSFRWSTTCAGVDAKQRQASLDLAGPAKSQSTKAQRQTGSGSRLPEHNGLPQCRRIDCMRYCFGPSPFCCHTCEQSVRRSVKEGAPSHCKSCLPQKRKCCNLAAMYGGSSHNQDCVNVERGQRLTQSCEGAKKPKKKRTRKFRPSLKRNTSKKEVKEQEQVRVQGPETETSSQSKDTCTGEGGKVEEQGQDKGKGKCKGKGKGTKDKKVRAFCGTGVAKTDGELFITNTCLQSMAGNTMSPPVPGTILLVLLAATTPVASQEKEKLKDVILNIMHKSTLNLILKSV